MRYQARYSIGGMGLVLLLLEFAFWGTVVPIYLLIDQLIPPFKLARPEYLPLQFIGPLLVLLFLLNIAWRNRAIRRFGDAGLVARLAPGLSSVRSALKFILMRFGLAWTAFALCGPQLAERKEEVKTKGVDVIVALDVSNSMLAMDKGFGVSRMQLATRALEQLINQLRGDRLGIVVFAGQAFTQLPLTSDASAARLFLGSIGPDIVPVQGTAIGAAIRQAQQGFDPNGKGGRTIIIITDGENHEDDAVAAAREAASAGITVNAVGMGSPSGTPIPIRAGHPEDGFRKDKEGNTVMSKLNVGMLQEIVAAGNGAFVQATPQRTGVQQLVEDLRNMEQTDRGSVQFTGHEDHYQWFLAVGMLLIFAALLTGERSFILSTANA